MINIIHIDCYYLNTVKKYYLFKKSRNNSYITNKIYTIKILDTLKIKYLALVWGTEGYVIYQENIYFVETGFIDNFHAEMSANIMIYLYNCREGNSEGINEESKS